MVLNYTQLVKHNKQFYDSFIELKLVGWNTYSKALNAYTFGFFKEQLDTANSNVEKVAKYMKGDFNE